MSRMLTIDGSYGEGGGQILRSALTLSAITGRPIHIEKIRARRKKPGLRPQHLTAVRAAAAICGARVEGAEIGSEELRFLPRALRGGDYSFDVGTAGSAMLVLQTLLLPLLFASTPSTVQITGGTHAIQAPPFHFVAHSYLPLLQKMGARVDLKLHRYGFFPAGGGQIEAVIEPLTDKLLPLEYISPGPLQSRRALATVAKLPEHIAQRELHTFFELTGWEEPDGEVVAVSDSLSPGNILMACLSFTDHNAFFSEPGRRGLPAEEVARRLARQVLDFLDSRAAFEPYLTDQILLPLALGQGGRFTTSQLTGHTKTQLWLLPQFIDLQISTVPRAPNLFEITLL